MSFVYQPEVFNQLVKALKKSAQTIDLDQYQATNVNNAAKKLVARLTGEFSPISSDNPHGAQLTLQSQNLNNLLQFLADDKIKYNNSRIAYDRNEYNSLNEDLKNELQLINNYWVSFDNLLSYVKYLQNKSIQEKNPFLQNITNKLIDQINQVKPNSLSKDIVKENVPEIADTIILDGFGSKVFDIKKPFDNGTLVLTAKNIKNKGALNDWLRLAPEAQVVIYQNNQPKIIRYTDPNVNREQVWNNILQVLSARANYRLSTARENEEKKYQYYVNKINELTGNISQPSSTEPQSKSTLTDKETSSPSNVSQQKNIIRSIIGYLPLQRGNVNLDRIEDFFQNIISIRSGDAGSRIRHYYATVIDKINRFKNFTQHRDAVINLNSGFSSFRSLFNNWTKEYMSGIQLLKDIITLTQSAIFELKAAYENQLSSDQLSLIDQQVGRHRNDNSIFYSNISDLQELESAWLSQRKI